MDGGEKVSGGFVVTRGDGPKLLEFGKGVLDGVPRLVERFVIPSLLFAVLLQGNHRPLSGGFQGFQHPRVRVITPVSQNGIGLHQRQQHVRTVQIVRLSFRQVKARGVAQGVARGVDFGAQAPLASPDRLRTVFFNAPALCGRGRTLVRSIMAYSGSARRPVP